MIAIAKMRVVNAIDGPSGHRFFILLVPDTAMTVYNRYEANDILEDIFRQYYGVKAWYNRDSNLTTVVRLSYSVQPIWHVLYSKVDHQTGPGWFNGWATAYKTRMAAKSAVINEITIHTLANLGS